MKLTPKQAKMFAVKAEKPELLPAAKESKYRNKKVVYNGITFHSERERDRYIVLCDMEAKGFIVNVQRQVKFPIVINEKLSCTYIADFTYKWNGGIDLIVEDVKPKPNKAGKRFLTETFKLKQKLVKAVLNIEIKIV